MGYIRRYGLFPGFFVPDVGEIVLASRSPAGPFLQAVVVRTERASDNRVRIDVVWMDSSALSASGTGVRAGEKGNLYISTDDLVPLVRRIPAPRSA